jgi:hypothetical protein
VVVSADLDCYRPIVVLSDSFLTNGPEDNKMAHELDPKELVDFREMVMVNTIQVDTIYQLLIQKGYFTEAEFLAKMKEVQADYQRGSN